MRHWKVVGGICQTIWHNPELEMAMMSVGVLYLRYCGPSVMAQQI
jgi:hypothetical protein